MKKLKSFFIGIMLVIFSCVSFVGCGTKKPESTQKKPQDSQPTSASVSTINLSEAKTIILNSLAIHRSQTASYSYGSRAANEENRDLLEKLGKFTLNSNAGRINVATNLVTDEWLTTGLYEYKNHKFVSYSENEGTSFLVDETVFDLTVDSYKQEYVLVSEYSESGTNLMLTCLFTDASFDNVYSNEVKKATTNDGFNLTLQGNLKGYMFLNYSMSVEDFNIDNFEAMWTSYEEEVKTCYTQAQLDTTGFSITIYFDNNNNIRKAVVQYRGCTPNDNGVNYIDYSTITIEESTEELIQPQWVTDYIERHSN